MCNKSEGVYSTPMKIKKRSKSIKLQNKIDSGVHYLTIHNVLDSVGFLILFHFNFIVKRDYFSNFRYGQEITFQTEHICDTEYDDPTSSEWDYYFDAKIIVSNDVLERKILTLRDNPKDEQDSGWSVLNKYR